MAQGMIIAKYMRNVLVAIDQLVNTICGGDPDETISSRAGKLVRKGNRGPAYLLCLLLNKLDKDHCKKYIEEDEGDDAVT